MRPVGGPQEGDGGNWESDSGMQTVTKVDPVHAQVEHAEGDEGEQQDAQDWDEAHEDLRE